ncbi:dimethylaniline monooxygenase [N-oxide-forming] [Elysia marginata]|uniref:Flavin-containing monooxygenase n=1 Tax=Elysia marginata TaxID=1093978 RepID=A0AAV4FWE0_9GAST|nr:dimethylaniline monooxygenase [N-oxide-forming] [Elysia marginata]
MYTYGIVMFFVCPGTQFREDPVFAVKQLFTPVYPYCYRLYGPGKWPGARHAIDTAYDRMVASFRTRSASRETSSRTSLGKNLMLLMIVVFAACIAFFAF